LTQVLLAATTETVAATSPSPPAQPSGGGDEASAIAALRAKYAACIASKGGPSLIAQDATFTSTGSDDGTFTIEIAYQGTLVGTWDVAPSGSVKPADEAASTASVECIELAN
jgi:hypothetical protein